MKLRKRHEQKAALTMGSFDGAELVGLEGLYIQSNLENILSKTNFGLYRCDGLILLRNFNGQQMDKKKEKLSSKL